MVKTPHLQVRELKVEWKKNIGNKQEVFTVGTFNVRTLKHDCDLLELGNAFKNSNIKILGLVASGSKETKRKVYYYQIR